jgi:hypothetical protein
MSGATPPLLQYVFMAWCLVKAQGQLSLPLPFTEEHITLQFILSTDNIINYTSLQIYV